MSATKGYVLRDIQEEKKQISLQQELLNLKIAKLQSLDRLENDPYIKNMYYGGTQRYIYTGYKVAKK